MKQEKFNIILERKLLRCNNKGKISSANFPKAFGSKEKNNFIKGEDSNNYILTLKTPKCQNIIDVYNKLEEISNVVYVELYNLNEIIWPYTSYKDIHLNSKLTLIIDKEYYEEIKAKNKNLPNKLDDALKNLKLGFKNNFELFENLFGDCTLKIKNNMIELSNINIDDSTRIGLKLDSIYFLVTFMFCHLDITEKQKLTDEIKLLSKVGKEYSLKSVESIKNVYNILKSDSNRNELEFETKLEIAKKYMKEGYDTRYCLQKYQKIVSESVVLIKDAISQGVNYNVLNEAKSLVELELNGHKEYVIEGNKTDRDSYIFPIITDDKFTSKQIMANAKLNVPNAILLEKDMDSEDIESLVSPFYNKPLVVKPRNTNYGTGITVFSKKTSKKQILNAIEYAFKFDTNVLIEEYVKGMEYRFLVVDGKCLSVAHRRIASIVGDGKSTIRELITEKNKEPWHFLTGTPVKMDEPVVEYLKNQSYDFDSIIPDGKRVFLRTNSNCSTGGESIDMTSVMPSKFKKIAEKAAKAFDAKICGVDIIIDDLKKDNYAIIEINDNPGYSINEWPYEGKGEKIGISILKLLNLVQEETV